MGWLKTLWVIIVSLVGGVKTYDVGRTFNDVTKVYNAVNGEYHIRCLEYMLVVRSNRVYIPSTSYFFYQVIMKHESDFTYGAYPQMGLSTTDFESPAHHHAMRAHIQKYAPSTLKSF